MADETTTGFMAISPPAPTGPLAIRKLVRGEDGLMHTVLVDARTGQQLDNLNGYNIVENGNYLNPNTLKPISPVDEHPDQEPASTAQLIIQDRVMDRGGNDVSDRGGYAGDSNDITSRNPSNNFGYIDKPGWMGLTGALPGMMGLAGKAANAAVNANNVGSVNAARSMMGIPGLSGWETAKGIAKDRQGQVADVNIGKNTYSVGLEALSPTGQTNLTPNEARTRGLLAGQIDVATPAQSKANTAAFKTDTGINKTGGLISTFASQAKSFIDSIFDNPVTETFPEAPAPATQANPRTSAALMGGSGDANRSYDGTSYSGQNKGLDSPRETNASSLGSGGGFGGLSSGSSGGGWGSESEASRGGGGVSSGGTGLW